ncbi:sensor domain-containing diguanylate cyclase [Vibrio sp. S4M6]|uniref:sensor domain-containing diguanylate cyclase n=1 Tax=Vibrio sinus TaxID=2946865 RepID=UPI00202AAD61|nr:sensor domain-containing diguanylate cyclase [Vibrio sinus]MCL9783445.1 sensor domain-containing diguanylate cyclase [Vibrio sinus]
MAVINESEELIRRIYQITNDYQKGFDIQISQLLILGLERFNLDIGILSKIEGNTYTVLNCVTPEEVDVNSGDTFDYDATYCEITCNTFGPVAIEHMGKNNQYASHPAYAAFGLEAYIGIPIFVDDELFGTLNFSSAKPYDRKFESTDIDALKLMASWVEVEMIRRKQEEQLQILNQKLKFQALNDPLTKIPNRRCMFKTLPSDIDRMKSSAGKGTLALVDIDHFKLVNDTHGHQVGDHVLVQIADALKDVVGSTEYLARFGGEEFVVWLPDREIGERNLVLKQVHECAREVKVEGKPITVSVGACHFAFDAVNEASGEKILDEFISLADECLYEAKSQGRNCIVAKEFGTVNVL